MTLDERLADLRSEVQGMGDGVTPVRLLAALRLALEQREMWFLANHAINTIERAVTLRAIDDADIIAKLEGRE